MPNYLKQKIILTGAVLTVLFGVLVLVIIPSIREIQDLKNKIIQEKAEIEERYNRRISTKLTLQRLKTLKQEFSDIYGKLYLVRGRELELITKIEDAALKYNVEQRLRLEVNLAAKVGIGNEEQIPLFLDISGNYINLLNYLTELEKSNIIITPVSLEIQQAGGGDSGTVNARIQAKTFWSKT